MRNVSHNKDWNRGSVQVHVDQPLIPIIRSKNNTKLDKDCLKIKLHIYPTSEKLGLYEFKAALFDNCKP